MQLCPPTVAIVTVTAIPIDTCTYYACIYDTVHVYCINIVISYYLCICICMCTYIYIYVYYCFFICLFAYLLSYHTPSLSYPILSYPILSHPILSYPILSYPIVSYPKDRMEPKRISTLEGARTKGYKGQLRMPCLAHLQDLLKGPSCVYCYC